MKKRIFCLIVSGCLLVVQASAQSPALPQTYSFTASSNMMGPMTITVNRNGSKELIEVAAASAGLHLRQLYDFQAHRVYTVDLSVNRCTTQEYTSAYAPALHDPIGGGEEMVREAGSLKTIRRETVNGIAARLVEAALQDGQGKYRFWLEDKFGFPVKQAIVLGNEPERLLFEIRQISYAPSAATLFNAPADCTRVAGVTNANGGHAEMNVDATAQGQAGRTAAATGNKAAPAGNPNQLLGKWDFTGKDGAGVQWRGTLMVEKLDEYSIGQGNYSNVCDVSVSSANSGKGASGPCLYDGRTKTFSFAGEGVSKFSFTAVLSPDGKSLRQGRWLEGDSASGDWAATRNSGAQPKR